MTTIKIQVPVTAKTEEKEITLPYFIKSGIHYYKIISEKFGGALQVCDTEDTFDIVAVSICVATSGDYEEITEAEFAAAYQRVRAKADEVVFGVGEPA